MLTRDQKQHLIDHGHLQVPQAIPRDLVDRARKAINAHIGEHGIPPEQLPIFRAQSYCPELKPSPEIQDLFHASAVHNMVESLLGEGNVRSVGSGQIALRFPNLKAQRGDKIGGHIDGIPTPTNGVKPGTLAHFTMLCGVLLSDLPDEYSGNFTVFPGSHHRYAKWFEGHEPIELAGGMPPVDMGTPKQITGKAGDVVFAHYLLGHGIAPNASPNIRYAVFFRVFNTRHTWNVYRPEAVKDLWLDWDGLHEQLGRSPVAAG